MLQSHERWLACMLASDRGWLHHKELLRSPTPCTIFNSFLPKSTLVSLPWLSRIPSPRCNQLCAVLHPCVHRCVAPHPLSSPGPLPQPPAELV
jgi:hypothetical protein